MVFFLSLLDPNGHSIRATLSFKPKCQRLTLRLTPPRLSTGWRRSLHARPKRLIAGEDSIARQPTVWRLFHPNNALSTVWLEAIKMQTPLTKKLSVIVSHPPPHERYKIAWPCARFLPPAIGQIPSPPDAEPSGRRHNRKISCPQS